MKAKLLLFICLIISISSQSRQIKDFTIEKGIALLGAGDDTSKVQVMNRLSRLYSYSEPDKAYDFAKNALKLSQKIRYKKGKTAAYTNLGNIYLSWKNYEKAEKCYEMALDVAKKMNNYDWIATSKSNLAFLKSHSGNKQEAKMELEAALALAGKNTLRKAYCYDITGDYYAQIGKNKEAFTNYYHALTIRENLKDNFDVSDSYRRLSGLYRKVNQYQKALDFQFKEYKLREKIGHREAVTTALYEIAALHSASGHWKTSNEFAIRCMVMAQNEKHKETAKLATTLVADNFSKQRDFKNAYKFLALSVEMTKALEEEKNKKILSDFEAEKKQLIEEHQQLLSAGVEQRIFCLAFLGFSLIATATLWILNNLKRISLKPSVSRALVLLFFLFSVEFAIFYYNEIISFSGYSFSLLLVGTIILSIIYQPVQIFLERKLSRQKSARRMNPIGRSIEPVL
jgi:tetratricopeptide (TPR) repeat protein